MPTLTVIYWRDIPAQVTARDGDRMAKKVLEDRFARAIDQAAVVADLAGSNEYLSQWTRRTRDCGPDLEAEVRAEADRLMAQHPDELLRALVKAGGRTTQE